MFALFQHELKYYFKNFKEAIYIYGLFISIILLAPFGLHHGTGELQSLAPAILWIALATTISLGGMSLFQRDGEEGRLEYYQLLPIPMEQLMLVKWAAFYLFIALPLLVVLPFAGLLLNVPPQSWPHYAKGLAIGAAALTAITALASAVMVGLEKAGAVLSLIILPLSIPVMIFGTYYCQHATTAGGDSGLMFNLGFACFLLPIYCYAGASCIRAAN